MNSVHINAKIIVVFAKGIETRKQKVILDNIFLNFPSYFKNERLTLLIDKPPDIYLLII